MGGYRLYITKALLICAASQTTQTWKILLNKSLGLIVIWIFSHLKMFK